MKYRNNHVSSRGEAIEQLKDAFEFVEHDCPGVCDFLIKEIVNGLTDPKILSGSSSSLQSISNNNGSNDSNEAMTGSGSPRRTISLYPPQSSSSQQHLNTSPSQLLHPQSLNSPTQGGQLGRQQATTSQSTAWKFRNAFN